LAVIGGNTSVSTNQNSSNLAPFNPFTQSPVQCTTPTVAQCPTAVVNGKTTPITNYFLGTATSTPTLFGARGTTATTFSQNGSFQLPRTYLYSIGARF
jgi:hypothetical protein